MSTFAFIPWFKLTGIHMPGLPPEVVIQPFGLLVATGVLLGMRLTEWRATRLGLSRKHLSDLITHVLITGFVISHVFDTLAYHPETVWTEPWALLMPWRNLSSFGGFFGAVIGAWIWQRRRQLPLLPLLEQVAFGLPLGWLFGRIGCFVVHDHPGALTDFVLAVNDYQYAGLPVGPRHDLGLYEALWSLAIVPLFLWLDRKPRPHGFFIATIVLLYAPLRFGLDFLRVGDATYGGLTPGHYASLLACATGLAMLVRVLRQRDYALPASLRDPHEHPIRQHATAPR